MINRDLYMNQLIMFKNKPFIKVISGMRRCGKSSLLELFKNHLLDSKVNNDAIIMINFESVVYDEIQDYKQLYQMIKDNIKSQQKTYLLLDEIQQVEKWEKAVNSFMVDFDVDIYITGSNSYLLSSELSTLLSGRYVEIRMLPLSFKEYLDFNPQTDISKQFDQYLKYGSLPAITHLLDQPETVSAFLLGIYNTVIVKDVVARNNIRDIVLLENVVKYIVQNIGSPISTKKISDYLTSANRKIASETIDNYLSILESAFIIYKAKRYDLKGKMHLKTLEKYYVVDTGIRNVILGYRDTDYGHILENIVYLELLRRGYEVSVGKVGTLEVDFVAIKQERKMYVQVTASINDEIVRKRELKSLQSIRDSYEKIIISMDNNFIKDYDGIKNIYLIDFLLNDDY